MFDTRLIYQVVEWERGLEIEDERRKDHRRDPRANGLAALQPRNKERQPFFARNFRRRARRPAYRCSPMEYCRETQLR